MSVPSSPTEKLSVLDQIPSVPLLSSKTVTVILDVSGSSKETPLKKLAATLSVIARLSGSEIEGASLIDFTFSVESKFLVVNSLVTTMVIATPSVLPTQGGLA